MSISIVKVGKDNNSANLKWTVLGIVMLMVMAALPPFSTTVGADEYTLDMSLEDAHASFWGEDANDNAGRRIAMAGDVNGDGYDDMLIGAYGDDDGGAAAGQVYLIFGKGTGWTMDVDLAAVDASFWGEDTNDVAGWSVAGAGDVNGDGFDDILIGASGDDDGGAGAGQTYLILGKSTGWTMDTDLSAADASYWGEDAGDGSGYSVDGVGDVNSDGYDDFIIGANGEDDGGNGAGQTYLILGAATGWAMDTDLSVVDASFWGEDFGDAAGFAVSGAGDVNGDGYDDFIIGAWGDDDVAAGSGQTYVILGMASGWAMDTDLSAADASYRGENANDWTGSRVSDAGDVNGDGYDDFMIGTYSNDDGGAGAGQAYLVLGKASGWAMDVGLGTVDASFWGEDAGDRAGYALASAGDVNSDGYDDILISSDQDEEAGAGSGQTYIVYGMASGWAMDTDLSTADASFHGEGPSDWSGSDIAGGADVNGDGYDDILIAATGNGDGGGLAGQVYLILPNSLPPAQQTLEARLTMNGGSILVSWGPPGYWNEPIVSFKLYRSTDGVNYNELGTFPALTGYYDDGDVIPGRTYHYAMVTVDGTGAMSEMSEVVSLICDKDTDMDGIGNSLDLDDDGDGIPDEFDAAPLAQDGVRWGRTDVDLTNFGLGIVGEDADDRAGWFVAGAGDVNGDGYDDILIGAYGDEDGGGGNAGQVYLFFGGPFSGSADIDIANADASFWAENSGDNAGYWLAVDGDVNGDGYDDILIGAWANDQAGGASGQTYLILGKDSGWYMDEDLSTSDASFVGEDGGDCSGFSVDFAGDVNGDGYDDIIIGAYGDDDGGPNAGQTYLIFGKTTGWEMDTDLSTADASYWGEDPSDFSGTLVAGGGDVNSDGFDDFLIGAYGDDDGGGQAGQTYLILGKASGWAMDIDLSAVDASFWGEDGSDTSGRSASLAGDVNGDGYDDILIGAYQDEDGGNWAGQTYLIFGKSTGWAMDTDLDTADASFWGEDASDNAGRSVTIAGDVNGDGYDDILIGAFGDDDGSSSSGQTYLIFGKASGWAMDTDLSTADVSFWGEDADDFSGFSVAMVGDVTGNGYDDILIGAYGDDDGGLFAGQSYFLNRTELSQVQNLTLNLTSAVTGLYLSWDDDYNDPYFYGVYRGTEPNSFYRLESTTASNYVDTNVTPGVDYYYAVSAVGPLGEEGPFSIAEGMVADLDTDGDGAGNMVDSDDDGDGVPDGQDFFPLDATESLDTDLDGIGNNADTDDDNDGVPDLSDPDPLNPLNGIQDDVDFLNTTLQDVQGTVNDIETNLTMLNSSLLDLTGDITAMNISLTNLINGLSLYLVGMNATIQGNISDMNASLTSDIALLNTAISNLAVDIAGVNATLQAEHTALMGLLNDINTNLTGLISQMGVDNARILTAIQDLAGNLSAVNQTLHQDIADLETDLKGDIMALGLILDGVNMSLQAEVDALAAEQQDFRNEMTVTFQVIIDRLDALELNLTDEIDQVEILINNINSTTLYDMRQQLTSIENDLSTLEDVDENVTEVLNDLSGLTIEIDDFRNDTETRLENITEIMAALDQLTTIVNDLETVNTDLQIIKGDLERLSNIESDLGDLEKEHAKTADNVATSSSAIWGVLILLIVVLALLGLLLMMTKGKGRPGPTDIEPVSRRPSRRKPVYDEYEEDEEEEEEEDYGALSAMESESDLDAAETDVDDETPVRKKKKAGGLDDIMDDLKKR